MKRKRSCLIFAVVIILAPFVIIASILLKKEFVQGEGAPVPGNDVIVATYFHGTVRCPSCLDIERLSMTALEGMFTAEMERGELLWRSIDYDQPGNEHYTKQYHLQHPSLVILRIAGSEEKEWKLLDKTWNLAEKDPDALVSYVQQEVLALLGGHLDFTSGTRR